MRARLAAAFVLAAVLALPAGAQGGGATAAARHYCGKIASTSVYPYARVYSLRRVSCRTARKVARRYDKYGTTYPRWACALAHGDRPRLFSCGRGGKSGDLRKWPYALEALGSKTR